MAEKRLMHTPSIDTLFEKISKLIEDARSKVASAVNLTMVYTNFEIGRYIVEEEQQGSKRAQYGKAIIKELSNKLTIEYGNGYSIETLRKMRRFFQIYSQRSIQSASLTEINFTLSWYHYMTLIRIENDDERRFYEIEAANNNWSGRHLERQYASSLYERLLLSRNKNEVLRLAQEGQVVSKPKDILKNPVTLEFLGMDEKNSYSESDLESKIISKLQMFLLEMGKGFLFEARQKRFTFDNQHFFVDLVLYNRQLQCYVLLDLKVGLLKHQDLGQMQMYVNYYDRYVKNEFEKPTVGILLCREHNKALVELTLPQDANIYSTEYTLYLPDKKLLQTKLKEWIEELDQTEFTEE